MLKGGGGTTSYEVVLTWELEVLAIVMGGGRKKLPPFKVRLRLLGAGLQHPGKIYSFLFSINILIIYYKSLDSQKKLLYKDLQYMAVSYKIKVYTIWEIENCSFQ